MTRSSAFSGLPEAFVEAVRGLFQLLDVEGKGWIELTDISAHWDEVVSGSSNPDHLPRDVLGSLHKASDKEGKLSLERFCAGLKIAILRHEAEKNRVVAAPSQDAPLHCVQSEEVKTKSNSPVLARTNSLPNMNAVVGGMRLSPYSGDDVKLSGGDAAPSPVPSEPCTFFGPPKPPRDPFRISGVFDKESLQQQEAPATSDAATSTTFGLDLGPQLQKVTKRPVKRRDSHQRRHTMQGGIDLGVVKRLRQLEEEKAVVEEGLLVAKRVQDWYHGRLRAIQDKARAGSSGVPQQTTASSSEAHQERLVFELQSLRELNQRLGSLLAVSGGRPGGGFPTHYNLHVQMPAAPPPPPPPQETDDDRVSLLVRQVERLKSQNKLLTEEVGKKGNFITNLEQEKSVLIKQLFQARSAAALSSSSSSSTAARPSSAMAPLRGGPPKRQHQHHYQQRSYDESTLM